MFWALLPILIYEFHQFSMMAFCANLIAVPVMMLGVIPIALLGAILLLLLPHLALLCFSLSNFLVIKLLQVLAYIALTPYWGRWVAEVSLINMLLALMGALIVFLPRGFCGRQLGFLLFIPLCFPKAEQVPLGSFTSRMLSTANGRVEVLRTNAHTIIIQDISNTRVAYQDVRYIIEPYLLSQGISHLDLWVLNGNLSYHQLLHLKNNWHQLSLGMIVPNHHFKIYDSGLIFCDAAPTWQWDQVEFSLQQNPLTKLCELKAVAHEH